MDTQISPALEPAYWQQACDYLVQRDRILRRLIPAHSGAALQLRACPFQTLLRIGVGQQASLALGRRLWAALQQACAGAIAPDCFAAMPDEQLRALGLPQRKLQNLRALCEFFAPHERLQLSWWQAHKDPEILALLGGIGGVGRRSTELFMIYYLGRPDVLPLDDTALLRAISQHYFSGEPVSRFEAREVSQAWAPWRTVASWHLWHSTGAWAVEY